MNGAGLRVGQIKDFLKASYEDNPPLNIGDFQLDNELSNKYGKVYFSVSQKKVIIIIRGTKGVADWQNNLIYSINSNAYKLTNRYKIAKKMYDNAHKKYKGYKIELLGHSQGSVATNLLLDEKKDLDGISLNPAYKFSNLKNNEYIIKSTLDPVSVLVKPKEIINNVLYPNWTKNHIINIPSDNLNLFKQHKVDILDNLDQNQFIGRKEGGSLYTIQSTFPFD
jgi:hypothetical protein